MISFTRCINLNIKRLFYYIKFILVIKKTSIREVFFITLFVWYKNNIYAVAVTPYALVNILNHSCSVSYNLPSAIAISSRSLKTILDISSVHQS